MKTAQSLIFIIAISPMAAAVSYAQGDEAMEDVLVTGTYSPANALTSAVSVLDEQQIRALNKRTVAGLLKTLPGVLVEEQGGPGGLTAVSIRGGEANFTLVLLDGVALNDPTNFRGGGFDFADLSTALVERVEVVRGAQSAIYGSDALAGVINIITRRPPEGHVQQLYVEAGEDDFSDLSFSAQGRAGSLEYTAELASRDDGEPVEGSERDSDRANLRLGWQAAANHRLSASYHYLDGDRSSYPEQSGGPEYALHDDLDTSDYKNQVWSLGWRAKVNNYWYSDIRASRMKREEDYSSPGIDPYFEVPPNGADTDYERDDLQWVNTLQLGDNYRINLGADYRDEEGDSEGYLEFFGFQVPTDFELDRSSTGVFADVAVTAIDDLLLQAALRYDDPDGYDSETSLNLGAGYTLTPQLTLSANRGEGFKLPSFFALGHALVGNPDLKPEKATSWDLGLRWDAAAQLRLELTYFFNDFEDLVDFDEESFRNVNRSEVETSGVEVQASWQPMESLNLSAQATYTDLDVKNENTVLTGRPDWTAGLVGEWAIFRNWSTVLDYHWTGEQYAASRHTGEEVTGKLDDFHSLDWVLRWQPRDFVQVQLSVDNLLDEDYENAVGFPGSGRAARIGVRFTNR
jgi:iron complex outermembrane receptor protein/vitamin B12 transporter